MHIRIRAFIDLFSYIEKRTRTIFKKRQNPFCNLILMHIFIFIIFYYFLHTGGRGE